MSLRISSRKDWIAKYFGGLAGRSGELPCPSRWEVFKEALIEDFPRLARLFGLAPASPAIGPDQSTGGTQND